MFRGCLTKSPSKEEVLQHEREMLQSHRERKNDPSMRSLFFDGLGSNMSDGDEDKDTSVKVRRRRRRREHNAVDVSRTELESIQSKREAWKWGTCARPDLSQSILFTNNEEVLFREVAKIY